MDTGHILFLVVGIVVVLVVGQLLVHSGGKYLARSAPSEGESARPAATLVAVLFHLFALGIVVLITVLPIGNSVAQAFLLRIGLLLVLLAVLYGVTLTQLGRRREEAIIAEVEMPNGPQQTPTPGGSGFPTAGTTTPQPRTAPGQSRTAPGQPRAVTPNQGEINPVPGIVDNNPPDSAPRY
jgi:hypothetical protein